MTNLAVAPSMVRRPESEEPIADFASYFAKSTAVVRKLPIATIERVADALYRAYEAGRSVFLFGNGGSAGLASHFACDLAKGTALPDRFAKRLRALSLADNLALITAWANDTSYEHVFAEQLRNFVQAGDVAFGISASGRSRNVLLGLHAAREAGAATIGLSGFEGGKLPEVCDVCIVVPSNNMQIIEDLHLAVTHSLFTVVRNRIHQAAKTRVGRGGAEAVAALQTR